MTPVQAEGVEIGRVAVVGAGAIGASWVTLLRHHGLDVVVTDPAPGAEAALRGEVDVRLGELGSSATGDLVFTADLERAGRDADLVLESGPERLDVKREIYAALDRFTRYDVVLASSSSGLPPSSFQDACAGHPERVLVAHPFNPPHLVPLVEVVGGRLTTEEPIRTVTAFLRRLGRTPVRIRRELPGHVANRLQAALWREAYHLVGQGAISVADLDLLVSSGPGLRWALLGPLATQHLSGGPAGLEHVLAHLGPPMVEWWADLGDPQLTPELIDRLVAGVRDELGGRERDVLARRDLALGDLLDVKARHGLDQGPVTATAGVPDA
jgi:3-hydroxyacyl-CoA dehydrogenase